MPEPKSPPPAPAAASSAPAPASAPTGCAPPADGVHFGKLTAVAEKTLAFDRAELLTGQAADEAAVEKGVIKPGEHVDNDYYIRDRDPGESCPLPSAEKIDVKLLPRSGPPDFTSGTSVQASSIARLVRYYAGKDPDSLLVQEAHYRLKIESGKVSAIEEVYFP